MWVPHGQTKAVCFSQYCLLLDVFWSLLRYLLCFTMLGQGTPLQNLLFLEELVLNYYKEFPQDVRFKNMPKLTMFVRKKGGPKLRGKAIEVRYFRHVILSLWARFYNPRLAIRRMILTFLKLNQQVDGILEEHKDSFALPEEAAKTFQETIFRMGHLHLLLEEHFSTEENTPHLFTATSKLHGLAHSGLLSKHINPRMVWCFTGEDYMRHIQQLCQACAKGTGPYLTVNTVIDVMRVALHLQFTQE